MDKGFFRCDDDEGFGFIEAWRIRVNQQRLVRLKQWSAIKIKKISPLFS